MAGEERGAPGGILGLLDFIEEHRTALTWDFRRYLNLSLDEIGETVSWGEVRALIVELTKETGSHLVAEMSGLARALSWGDLAGVLLSEAYLNVHRDPKKNRSPVRLFDVWAGPNADVTPERRQELREQLERRSAFR